MKSILFSSLVIAATAAFGAGGESSKAYVAHEWGTFTSVQAADGVQLEWNPRQFVELPKFVHQLRIPLTGKSGAFTRQRMETPVIYFYPSQSMTVDVSVDFPRGRMTEWYPAVDGPAPWRTLHWPNLSIIPGKPAHAYPVEETGNHYYGARETDSATVEVQTKDAGVESEKFLFYRGVGDFAAPLLVKTEGPNAEKITLTNATDDPLAHLFLFEVRGGEGRMHYIAQLGSTSAVTVAWPPQGAAQPLSEFRKLLAERVAKGLVGSRLYPREAEAMVKTWDDSWFAEEGLRVLYILPRAWTDTVLPIQFTPVPKELERVMIGRAEVLTPQIEAKFAAEVERYQTGDEAAKALAVSNTRNLKLGRFLEAVRNHVCGSGLYSEQFNSAAWTLVTAANQPAS